jgi:hypothetical protein
MLDPGSKRLRYNRVQIRHSITTRIATSAFVACDDQGYEKYSTNPVMIDAGGSADLQKKRGRRENSTAMWL